MHAIHDIYPPTVEDIAHAYQSHYVDCMAGAILHAQQEFGAENVLTEEAFSGPIEEKGEHGLWTGLAPVLRPDIVIKKTELTSLPSGVVGGTLREFSGRDSILYVDTGEPDNLFSPITLNLGNLDLTIGPFQWEFCRVTLVGKSVDLKPLDAWFSHWFFNENPSPNGCRGVIHDVFERERSANEVRIKIDFGTAPVEAFMDFVIGLPATNADQVHIAQCAWC